VQQSPVAQQGFMTEHSCTLVKQNSLMRQGEESFGFDRGLQALPLAGFVTPPQLSGNAHERRRQIQNNLTILDELEHSMQRAVIDALQPAAPHSQNDAAQMLVYLEWVEETRRSLSGLLWHKAAEPSLISIK
jgi:hypothetical protein